MFNGYGYDTGLYDGYDEYDMVAVLDNYGEVDTDAIINENTFSRGYQYILTGDNGMRHVTRYAHDSKTACEVLYAKLHNMMWTQVQALHVHGYRAQY